MDGLSFLAEAAFEYERNDVFTNGRKRRDMCDDRAQKLPRTSQAQPLSREFMGPGSEMFQLSLNSMRSLSPKSVAAYKFRVTEDGPTIGRSVSSSESTSSKLSHSETVREYSPSLSPSPKSSDPTLLSLFPMAAGATRAPSPAPFHPYGHETLSLCALGAESMDLGSSRPQYTCSRCGGVGHNRRSCESQTEKPLRHQVTALASPSSDVVEAPAPEVPRRVVIKASKPTAKSKAKAAANPAADQDRPLRKLQAHMEAMSASPPATHEQIQSCLATLKRPIPCTNKNLIVRLTGGGTNSGAVMRDDVRQILYAGDTKEAKEIPVEFLDRSWYLSSAVPSRRKRCSRQFFEHASKYWLRDGGSGSAAWVSIFQYDNRESEEVRVKLTGVVTDAVLQFVCFLYNRTGFNVEMRCATYSTSVFKDQRLCIDPERIAQRYVPDGEVSRNQSNCAMQWPLRVGTDIVKIFFHTGGAVQVLGTLDEPDEPLVRDFLVDVLTNNPDIVRHLPHAVRQR